MRLLLVLVTLALLPASGAGQTTSFAPELRKVDLGNSGLFWFFQPDNWEVLVKVLDGCSLNDHFWVFSAATTNVEYTLTVTDLVTNETKSYVNPLGIAAPALTDTEALATCSADSSLITCTPSATDLCLSDRFVVNVEWRDFMGQTGIGRVVPITRFEPSLNVFVNPSILNVQGTAEVTVFATDSVGTPLPGQRVRLFTGLGAFDSRTVVTDDDGEATATYTAGVRPGVDLITAILGVSEATNQVTLLDAPGFIFLRASHTSIPAGTDSMLEVQAVVANPLGEPLPGILVTFDTDREVGSFLSGNTRFTNAEGRANTTLTVNADLIEQLSEFRIIARVNAGGSILDDNVTIRVLN